MFDTFDSDGQGTDFRGNIVNTGNGFCINESILN